MHKIESDYAEVRLAEVYYMLAECRFRLGNKAQAVQLLNTVRKRYYPANSPSLYPTDGSTLTEQELLDDWGLEFVIRGIN
ncbi:RagB/SusD family nutrient uptake outer membrane protein [Fibrella arboris]|uniref:RagB/SusD family nutrient uptake outer membrane protein n=1 Tax=Fibrella arboris TaxID=3242486 RepID=UPI0035200300